MPELAWEIPGFQEPLTSNSHPESPPERMPPPFPRKHSLYNYCLSHNSDPSPLMPPPLYPSDTHPPCLFYSALALVALHFSKLPQSQGQQKHRCGNLVSILPIRLALPELERWSLWESSQGLRWLEVPSLAEQQRSEILSVGRKWGVVGFPWRKLRPESWVLPTFACLQASWHLESPSLWP